jgi:A/G-specific adenine glycosylase
MAQQTRIEVVLAYFERFVARFPNIEALAAASDDEVTAAWSGLGYYRRARMLRDGARAVRERFGGRLPRGINELRSIPGIGRYTAGAISSIAFRRPAPIVDGNVARILARLFAIDEALGTPALMRAAWTRAEALVALAAAPRDFNQGLMEIGALICTPRKPACGRCPLRGDCAAFAADRVAELPRPKAKPATRSMTIALYVITNRGRVLMRREKGALMGELWHLPHGDTSLLTGKPLRVDNAKALGSFRHTVTNRRITFTVFKATTNDQGRTSWIAPEDLPTIPHPSYVRKALRLAGLCK